MFWKLIYITYPPILRVLEGLGIHKGRQVFHVGYISLSLCSIDSIKEYLREKGFEPAILAWKDSDELVSYRKIDNKIFQWHVRIHKDGEVRGHYEYSSEGNPWKHVREVGLREDKTFFKTLLKDFFI